MSFQNHIVARCLGILATIMVASDAGAQFVQQGAKLVGAGAAGAAYQGHASALSADGNTAVVAGIADNNFLGAAWVFTRSAGVWNQQGNKLIGSEALF